MKEKQYALMFDGTDRSDLFTGPASEVAKKFLKSEGGELKVEKNEGGVLEYSIRFNSEEGEDEWEPMNILGDQGSEKANRAAAFADYLLSFLMDDEYENYRVFELDTPERKALFDWTFDAVLDHITAREFRDAELDWDEGCEFEVRCWYYDNKCPALEE